MTRIRIQEQGATDGAYSAVLSFNDEGQMPGVQVADPFSPEREKELEWYFEQHLRLPFVDKVRRENAARSITDYGESLFKQVIRDHVTVYARYAQALADGIESLQFEIVGSPDFHRLHWETLKDPDQSHPFALHATIVRKNLLVQQMPAAMPESPTINLLLIVARPHGAHDVGYRTISRPLVEGLRKANLRVHIDIVRPGTYKALARHLESVPAGHYHVIHFDLHGNVLTYDQLEGLKSSGRFLYQSRYGLDDIKKFDGHRAFIAFESGEPGRAVPVEAQEIADLLQNKQIPIAILNACQSGKQVGDAETSLGSHLLQAGVQCVLAMGYSVTVTAAELMMRSLYQKLFDGTDLSQAIRLARFELHNDKGRRAYFNHTIDLEDWMLPVVYQNQTQELRTRDFTPEEQQAYYQRQAQRFPFPNPTYGFVGRDVDILEVEKRILGTSNELLVRGMGGTGKTTLLRHLGAWWQTTHFVEEVFYFGYDARAWKLEHILQEMAPSLLKPAELDGFTSASLGAKVSQTAERLRAKRHVLILDNLESIQGDPLAIPNTLEPEEQQALKGFLTELLGGNSIVLLGSRSGEEWLADGTFGDNTYGLEGLDSEAASEMADRILKRIGKTPFKADTDFQDLVKILNGYPLALEIVLPNLAQRTPSEVRKALQDGDVSLDSPDVDDKTRNLVKCIDYSYNNLSPGAQGLLLCLAPFTSVFNLGALKQYTEHLSGQAPLKDLPFEQWDQVLEEAQNWGLMTPHSEISNMAGLQPIFPYFLRSRLKAEGREEMRQAVNTAFRQHYNGLGGLLSQLMDAKEPDKKRLGQALTRLEYENLTSALDLSLEAKDSIVEPYAALDAYLDTTQDHRRGLQLGEKVLRALDEYPDEALAGPMGQEFVGVLDTIALRQLRLNRLVDARESYERALSLCLGFKGFEDGEKRRRSASIHHQLGNVAEEERKWDEARKHYNQALAIYVEFGESDRQASTYHQLGNVAARERKWDEARENYNQALEIKVEFNDRHGQASTYHQLGIVAEEEHKWDEARKNYNQALEIEVEFNDRHDQAATYHQLGSVAHQERKWSEARENYNQALKIKAEFGDRYGQASTYHQLGRVDEEEGQWQAAADSLLQSLGIYSEFEDLHYSGIVIGSIARVWRDGQDGALPGAVGMILGCSTEEAEEELRKALEAQE